MESEKSTTNLPTVRRIALDGLAHALPLVFFYGRSGNVHGYLLLTASDLALGLMLIVGTTRDVKDPTTVDPRATWLISRMTAALILSIFLGMAAAILTVPLGMPAFFSEWPRRWIGWN